MNSPPCSWAIRDEFCAVWGHVRGRLANNPPRTRGGFRGEFFTKFAPNSGRVFGQVHGKCFAVPKQAANWALGTCGASCGTLNLPPTACTWLCVHGAGGAARGRLGVISLLAQPAVASLMTELVGWPPLWPCQARLWLPTAIEIPCEIQNPNVSIMQRINCHQR